VERCHYRTACESLKHTRNPVRNIAALLGYRDVSSFSRAFLRWTDKTPGAYRNQSPGRPGKRPVPALRPLPVVTRGQAQRLAQSQAESLVTSRAKKRVTRNTQLQGIVTCAVVLHFKEKAVIVSTST